MYNRRYLILFRFLFYPPTTKSFDGFIGTYVCSRIRYVIVSDRVIVSDQDTIYDVIIFPIMILCKVMLL